MTFKQYYRNIKGKYAKNCKDFYDVNSLENEYFLRHLYYKCFIERDDNRQYLRNIKELLRTDGLLEKFTDIELAVRCEDKNNKRYRNGIKYGLIFATFTYQTNWNKHKALFQRH